MSRLERWNETETEQDSDYFTRGLLVIGQGFLVDDTNGAGVFRRGAIESNKLLGHLDSDTDLSLGSASAQVGRGHDFGMIDECLGNRRLGWFLGIHIEGSASAFATLKCVQYGLLIDNAATRNIDNLYALLALGQRLLGDEICVGIRK